MGICQRYHQPDGGGFSDTSGTVGCQGFAYPVCLLRRLRDHGDSCSLVYPEVQLQAGHPTGPTPLRLWGLPLHPCGSLPGVFILLLVTLYPHFWARLSGDDGQPLHPLAR